jgi:hypothetical protein
MGIGYALGTGFLNRAVKQQDENLDEARSNRQLAMKVWMTDTLPKVQAARAADAEAMSHINDFMKDDYFKGNVPLAFMAGKGIQSGLYKSLDHFKADVDNGKIVLPPEARAAQEAELGKYFDISRDDMGTATGMALKPETPVNPNSMPAVAGGQQPGFFDRLMGKSNPAQDMQETRGKFSAMTGIDPMAAHTTSRIQGINIPGVSVPTIDQRKEGFQKEALAFVQKNPDLIKNPNLFADRLAAGDMDGAIKAGEMFSAKDIRQEQYNNQYRLKVMEMLPELNNGNAVLGALFSPNFNRDKLGSVLKGQFKTEDEKIAYLTKLETAKQRIAGLDDPQKVLLLDAQGLLAPLLPDSADYNKFVGEAKKQYTDKVNAMNAYTNRILNPDGSVNPNAANPPSPGAAAQPQTGKETPAAATTETPEKAKAPKADPWASPTGANTGITYENEKPKEAPRARRVGEDANNQPSQDRALIDLITSKEPAVKVREANPLSVIKSMKTITDTTRKAEVAKNITFTQADAQKFFGESYNENASVLERDVAPYLKEYKSSAEAAKEVEIGQLFKSGGNISIMTPDLKKSGQSK